MKPIVFLLLIFLSACSIVQIEVRDKKAQTEVRKGQTPQEKKPAISQKEDKAPQASKPQGETLKVATPVRGKIARTERGYFITTSCGEFFRSVGNGRVLYAGDDIRNMGWVVMVDSEDGYVYVYARAGSSLVKRGETVRRGQPLGRVGNSGDSCGILFEIRDQEGRPVNFELVI
ncbi:murein hydrolase activator EnvC family protein [Pampinifervens florentissimum]|uniref:murein hydrolase activator EnvC family protein n=1 Tax=Pampinifervens florentissimum TaxID=1632019 RepID=UPI0013B49E67|nr:M23 family metallopeptidase [Hydrogenobacter sp. T-8]QID32681.1 M23 family metallopeptidase [Hydrogenobacter sp. T-8]